MTLDVFTDGGSKGNPGPAAIGIAFYIGKMRIHTYREDIGHATNNEAEYMAVIRALEIVQKKLVSEWNDISAVGFHSDSQLVVRQLNGLYKIKHPQIRTLIDRVKSLENAIQIPISYIDIPREKNQIADALVNNRLLT